MFLLAIRLRVLAVCLASILLLDGIFSFSPVASTTKNRGRIRKTTTTAPDDGALVRRRPFCLSKFQHQHRRIDHLHYASLEETFESISDFYTKKTVDDIQKDIVRRGLAFARQSNDASETDILANNADANQQFLASESTKVSGCIANVHVQTVLTASDSDESSLSSNDDTSVSPPFRVHSIQGTADALLSRGLLAILAHVVQNQSVERIIELQPQDMALRLGVQRALSPGRNDGLASMLRTVQEQIQQVTQQDSELTNKQPIESRASLSAKDTPNNKNKAPSTVALLLSGGVDSSVALNLLKRDGYNVTAFYLKIWLEDELAHLGQCPWEDDFRMCQAVCQQANVPLEAISLQDAYKQRVINYTVNEAKQGRTPNPDIMCNSRIKFGCFYDEISSRGFDYVATGHYAQLVRDPDNNTDRMKLFRAPDPVKDQSYFLCALTQDQLQRVRFPIGHLEKSQVRQLAEEFQLPNRKRPDSQGLCFLGKVKFDAFLSAYLGERPGDIIDAATGDLLGRHKGIWYHTVGQRKGIGKVLNPLATSRGPWYVVAKDPQQDIVFCSNQYDQDIFTSARSKFSVENIQWIAGHYPSLDDKKADERVLFLTMKIRHGPTLVTGILKLHDETGCSGDVELNQKDSGLAPGQYVVFYRENECLGGGVISERHWTKFLLEREEATNFDLLCNATTR